MLFDFTLGLEAVPEDSGSIFTREAIRAVIFEENKLLMVKNKMGDYKFPGGGMEKNESHEETLEREIAEETGHILKKVHNKIGEATQRKFSNESDSSIFQMFSYYYICELSEGLTSRNLDQYEKDLDFQAEWIDLDEVILKNETVLKEASPNMNPWVERETIVLRKLKESRAFL